MVMDEDDIYSYYLLLPDKGVIPPSDSVIHGHEPTVRRTAQYRRHLVDLPRAFVHEESSLRRGMFVF